MDGELMDGELTSGDLMDRELMSGGWTLGWLCCELLITRDHCVARSLPAQARLLGHT